MHPRDHGELRGFARAARAAAAAQPLPRAATSRADVAWVSARALRWSPALRFDAVGGFDPGFFLYKEEEDLFLRIRRRGGRVLYEPSVRVLHVGSVTGVRQEHLDASVRRFRHKHVRSRVRRAVMPAAYEGWVRVSGRMRRLVGAVTSPVTPQDPNARRR